MAKLTIDADLDFLPLKLSSMGELVNGTFYFTNGTRGNSVKSQLDEIWNRKGVALTMNRPQWLTTDGRVYGFRKGTIYSWQNRKVVSSKTKKKNQLELI